MHPRDMTRMTNQHWTKRWGCLRKGLKRSHDMNMPSLLQLNQHCTDCVQPGMFQPLCKKNLRLLATIVSRFLRLQAIWSQEFFKWKCNKMQSLWPRMSLFILPTHLQYWFRAHRRICTQVKALQILSDKERKCLLATSGGYSIAPSL